MVLPFDLDRVLLWPLNIRWAKHAINASKLEVTATNENSPLIGKPPWACN